MKIKTSELTDAPLRWAVARCEGAVSDDIDDFCLSLEGEYAYPTDWAQGGPIIEREKIATRFDSDEGEWQATIEELDGWTYGWGSTPLIAAMRCFVFSRLGDEVEIPEELK
jgi:hypothetical protein